MRRRAAKTGIERQIDATDRQIDGSTSGTEARRYALYGLTEQEIRIVEEATQ